MTLNEIVDLAVQWGPTCLFLLIVLFKFLTGLRRGFRKSLILAINAIVAFALVIVAYLNTVNDPLIDEYIVTYSNVSLEALGQDSIQSLLGASNNATSFKEILTEIIPKYMDYGEGVEAVVQENGAYLGALVNSVYHLVFAIAYSIIYVFILFIFYIGYLIFLPERRYKRKKNKLHIAGKGEPYRKRRLLGGLVGTIRGVVGAVVFLSFFGSLLFIVTGGSGSEESEDVTFGDAQIDQYYDIYESVSEYGNYGIYALLNTIKDKNDVPYYLYIADIVLSGSYEDKENDINAEIIYRDEVGNYVKFAKSTVELLMKYGSEELKPIINGQSDDIEGVLTIIFAKEGFKEEFNVIIDEFEEDTFFINFALSAVDSIAKNINDFNFVDGLDQTTRDLLNILLTGEDAITVSNILNKEDAKLLLNAVITIMAENEENTEEKSETLKTITYIKKVLPDVTKLSMFTDEHKNAKGNKILANVYDYVLNTLTNDETQTIQTSMNSDKIMKLANKTANEVDWMNELASLIDVGIDALTIYENNYNEEDQISALLHMLDADNPNKDLNKTSLDKIIDSVSKSEILGLALSTTYVNDMLVDALSSIAEGIVLPQDVDYVREINADGTVKTEGEIYTLLTSVEMLLENGFGDFYDKLQSEDGFANETEQLTALKDLLLTETEESSVIDTLLNSKLLKYTLSQVITSVEVEGFTIVIPEVCQEDVPENVVIIKNDTLKNLFENVVLILPENGEESIDVKKILNNKDSILSNEILHATVINFLIDTFNQADSEITIPEAYKVTKEDLETAYLTNKWIVDNEVSKILDALDAIFNITTSEETFDINNISLESAMINKNSVATSLESNVIHYTISDLIEDLATGEDSQITIPALAYVDNVISKTELVELVSSVALILEDDQNANININDISFDDLAINKEDVSYAVTNSSIIHYTISDLIEDLATGEDSTIIIPQKAYEAETTVIKTTELTQLVSSVALLLEGNKDADIDINNISLDNISINKEVVSEVVTNSSIIHYTISDMVVDLSDDSTVVIPQKAYEAETTVITTTELVGLVSSLALILENDEEANIDINNVSLDTITVNKSVISKVVTNSTIIHYTISDKVENLSDDSTIIIPKKAYEAETTVITTTELTQLVSSVALLLQGDENAEIDINNISLEGLTVNKVVISQVVNSSSIIHYTISDKIVSSLDTNNINIPTEAKISGEEVVTTTEIESLFGSLGIILKDDENADFNIDGFTVDTVKLSSSKVEKVLSSLIIKRKITEEISSDNILVLVDDVYETSERLDIKPVEIKKLIYSLEVFTDNPNGIDLYATSFDNIVISKEKIEENEGSLDSLIFLQQVSDKLFNILENKIPQEACQSEYTITTDGSIKKVALIESNEIENVVIALQTLSGSPLSVDTGFNVDTAKVSTASDGSGNLDEILGSNIVWYMVSETILSNVGTTVKSSLLTTKIKNSDATLQSDDRYYIVEDEIELLIKTIGTYDNVNEIYEVNVGNSMDFSSFDTNKINLIKESSILRYKVSNIIFDSQLSNLTVPYQALEINVDTVTALTAGGYSESSTDKTINYNEFDKFLTALSMVMGDGESFDNFNVGLPTSEDDFIKVAQSDIMRATITSKMKITRGSSELDIVVSAQNVDLVSYTNFDNSALLPVLTQDEVVYSLFVVSKLSADNSYEFTFEIDTIGALDIVTIDKLLNSSIFRCLLSDLLLEGSAYAKIYHVAKYANETITIAQLANKEITLKVHEIYSTSYGLRYDEANQANSDFILTDTYVIGGNTTQDYVVSHDSALAYFYILQN